MTEILIVTAIILILSALLMTRLPAIRTQTRINSTAANIQRAIREARRRSTTIVEFKRGNQSTYPSYGVYFNTAEPTRLTLYADCVFDDNGDGVINNQDTFTFVLSSNKCLGANGFVENILLEPTIRVSAIRTFNTNPFSGTSQSNAAVLFLRPEPSVWISDQSGTLLGLGGIAVEISDQTNRWKKTIVVWITGDIEIR